MQTLLNLKVGSYSALARVVCHAMRCAGSTSAPFGGNPSQVMLGHRRVIACEEQRQRVHGNVAQRSLNALAVEYNLTQLRYCTTALHNCIARQITREYEPTLMLHRQHNRKNLCAGKKRQLFGSAFDLSCKNGECQNNKRSGEG